MKSTMTRKEYKHFNKKAQLGLIKDELNPAFIFSDVDSKLLVEILTSKYNLIEIAKRELENRGLDENGKWAGFNYEIK